MVLHPYVHLEIARQRHEDLLARAERHRIARASGRAAAPPRVRRRQGHAGASRPASTLAAAGPPQSVAHVAFGVDGDGGGIDAGSPVSLAHEKVNHFERKTMKNLIPLMPRHRATQAAGGFGSGRGCGRRSRDRGRPRGCLAGPVSIPEAGLRGA